MHRIVALSLAFVLAVAVLTSAQTAYVLRVDEEIRRGTVSYLGQGLRAAADGGADVVIVVLSTPGGELDAAVAARDVLFDSAVPTVAYVNREALSAGALLAITCHRIYFAPGGVLGAATPVYLEGDTMREAPEKVISAMRALFASTAEARGREPTVAEAMVDRDVEIPSLVAAGKLLTLSAGDAAAQGYSDGDAATLSALLAQLDLASAQLVRYDRRFLDSLVAFLTSSLGAALLITFGVLGLLTEMLVPGFGISGVIGLVCLGLFFWSHGLVGMAGWESITYLLGGIIAVLLEIFVFTAVDFGITGLAGLFLIGLGFYSAMVGPFTSREHALQAIGLVAAGLIVSLSVSLVLLAKLPKTRLRLGGVILSSAVSGRAFDRDDTDPQAASSVGKRGVAVTDLHPVGIGLFDGRRMDVISEGGHVPRGALIEIVEETGYRKVVRRTEEEER